MAVATAAVVRPARRVAAVADDADMALIDQLMLLFLSALGMAVLKAEKPGAVVITVADLLAAEAIIMLGKIEGLDHDATLEKHVEHVKMVLAEKVTH